LEYFRRAAELKPDLLPAQYNSGLQLWKLDRPDEALAYFDRALVLAPGPESVRILRVRACVLRELGRLQEAEQDFLQVLALTPDDADARLSLAFVRLQRSEFRAGWQDYEARYATAESPRRDFPCPDWQGESIAQASLLVYAEQGLGDELLFACCVPDVVTRCRRLIIDCEPRLAKLFARSFPAARRGLPNSCPITKSRRAACHDFCATRQAIFRRPIAI
jgi:tetratricopeptide (TPR) repeat protein